MSVDNDGAVMGLAERYGAVPFSVWDQRAGAWQSRKRRWLRTGLASGDGRGEKLTYGSASGRVPDYYAQKATADKRAGRTLTHEEFERNYLKDHHAETTIGSGTSQFDPVLCELALRWWSPADALVLDPFAGGSVRGVISASMGRQYVGTDVRQEQIDANDDKANDLIGRGWSPDAMPSWVLGDARTCDQALGDRRADMVLTCPPYADLEVYSDQPDDISTLDYDQFLEAHRLSLAAAARGLRDNAFAVWVISDLRDKRGSYRGLVADTIRDAASVGLALHNDIILISPVGSLAVRSARPFEATRKVGRTHQHVLVFVKGDAKLAAGQCCDPLVDVVEWPPERVREDQPPQLFTM
jgi:hypothetical protein